MIDAAMNNNAKRLKKLFLDFSNRLKVGYNYFILPQKQWRLPKKSDILIYDMEGSDALLPYLSSYCYEFIPMRGEFIIVPLVLCAICHPCRILLYSTTFLQSS